MTDPVALAVEPGVSIAGPRRRAGVFLLLQLLTLAACLGLFTLSPPTPPTDYAITSATLVQDGHAQEVQLPYSLPSTFTMADPPVFTATFQYWPDAAATPWSLMLPRFGNAVEVSINGQVVLDTRLDPEANRHLNNIAVMAVIPSATLRAGDNTLSLRLFVWGPLRGYLDCVFVGPSSELRPAFRTRSFLFTTLPLIFKAWQGILAVILAIMWLNRRHDVAYGVLAIAMVLGVVQGLTTTPLAGGPQSSLAVLLGATTPLETALMFVFVSLFFRGRVPLWTPILFLPAVTVVGCAIFGDPWLLRWVYALFGVPAGGIMVCLCLGVVAQRALRQGDVVSLSLSCALTVVLAAWIYDMLVAADVIHHGRIFLARNSYSFLLVTIGAGLTWRFAHALNEVDNFAHRMVELVHEAEEKVRASFAREEERSRAIALAAERARLMRDLHDGLGGQLMSIVALSERGAEGERINQAARAALRELRLVIEAMDDMGGDLLLALGSWRERAQAQLRSHGIRLDWQAEQQGLPIHPELRPWHVIQIVRILDEAITNAARHSGATRVLVRLGSGTEPDDHAVPAVGGGWIRVSDNGRGLATRLGAPTPSRQGRGLANMRTRAAMCGAKLEITSDAAGTSIRLALPLTLPAAPLTETLTGA
ncbi:sensor histidine kinase [Ancylobacter sp. SL191]|uniref:sensor histidine kinase n=1 Tax=Ancylobacter sp. SL191 TaxID=2995166 RepID=UPI002270BCEA|nr:ATP-binding protein [Ancylobacter sp. SL191]WAC27469.1 ATP-binding protein [Ancylobacter sp. SL191]